MMIYYGYTSKDTQDPPTTLLQFRGENEKLLEEVEKSLYNTLIQVPLHHFFQVYNTLRQHSNTVAMLGEDQTFTYYDVSGVLDKVKNQIIGELQHEC